MSRLEGKDKIHKNKMSRSREAALKRKRPGSEDGPLTDADLAVLNVIKSKKDIGIWARDIKKDINLSDVIVNKALKSLASKKLIKEVANIQNKGRKHYMAVEFEPSKEITGGAWYVEGHLDKEFIEALKKLCRNLVSSQKVATIDSVFKTIEEKRIVKDCTRQQVEEILNSLVLDNEILEVKSTGLGEYHSIPVGSLCYRTTKAVGVDKGFKIGAMASIPCGMCPRISQCTPDGIISPKTCVYFEKWLDIEF